MDSSGLAGLRPVQQPQKGNHEKASCWRDSDDDCRDCNWPVGPISLTPLDKRLWASLLDDCNCDGTERCQNRTSNGSNNLWAGGTSEELIPPSAASPEPLLSTQRAQPERGASLRRQLTLARALGSIGGATTSGSSTLRPARVVNWAAEACDRRWIIMAEASRPLVDIDRINSTTCSEAMRQCALRKARLMAKRLPQRVVLCPESRQPKQLFRVPIRTGGVNGVELFLSSVADSPQPQSALPATELRGSDQRLPQDDLRQPDERRPLPSKHLTKLWHPRLLDVKTATAASTCSLDSDRIPSSDAPELFAKLPLQTGTSEVTMDISGDSLSPDSDDADEPLLLSETEPLPEEDRVTFGLSVDWRNVVSISVNAGGGQTTTVATTAAALAEPAAAATLAPLAGANSKTASTNTEQSASTTMVVGACDLIALDARVAKIARFSAKQGVATTSCQKRLHLAPQLFHRREPQLPLSWRRHPRPHMARILQRHDAVSLSPIWILCGSPLASDNACVVSVRHCLNSSQFAWQNQLPARCSRTSCQLLLGPLDISQSSESQLALPRVPVYAHRRSPNTVTPVASALMQLAGPCVKVTAPEVLRALRFVMPSQTGDWLPPDASSSSEAANNQSPLAMLWSQRISFFPQPTNSVGLQFPSVPAARFVPPTRPVVFQVASVSEAGTPRVEVAPRMARKSQHLQELRRIVRMKMQQKMQDQEFVGVAYSCCSCCSSPPNVEAVVEAPGGAATMATQAADAGKAGEEGSEAAMEDQRSSSDPLERSLGGLLDSLRSCRHTASVAAKVQRRQRWRRRRSGDRQLVNFIEKILRESTSQQAALKDLLASLTDAPPPPPPPPPTPPGDKQQIEAEMADKEADEEPSTRSNISGSQSDQFYSLHTGTAGQPPDLGTRASGRTADVFRTPSETHGGGMDAFGAESANNNAEASSAMQPATPSPASSGGPSTGQRRRHRSYYARRRLVRLEKCAALLVHEAASQACSLESNCFGRRQDWTGNWNSSASASVRNGAATDAAVCRQNLSRLRALERRVLAQAWRNHPPIPQRLLDGLDPTVASFIWWSLIPRHRPVRLPPDARGWTHATTPGSLSTASLLYEVEISTGKATSGAEVSDATRISLAARSLASEWEVAGEYLTPARQLCG